MRYYLDTEFIERPCTIDLISIGIATEDGRTLYAENYEFDPSHASPWVRENVLIHLSTYPADRFSRENIKRGILALVGYDPAVEFWGYYADYDWVAFCWLFGPMVELPTYFPRYCRDLKQVLDERGNPAIPEQIKPVNAHNALDDAQYHMRIHEWIEKGCPV